MTDILAGENKQLLDTNTTTKRQRTQDLNVVMSKFSVIPQLKEFK